MERKCRYEPLVLVLCQVRFTPVRQIARYIPAIQERFRRTGFAIERAETVRQVTIEHREQASVQVAEQQRWEYRTPKKTWSILVTQDSVILQTTDYTRFEGFAQRLAEALGTVLSESEHEDPGLVQRVGLRYIDAVRPSPGRDRRFYLRPGLHGVADKAFQPGQHLLHIQNGGGTLVGGHPGTLVVRIAQNNRGSLLPADLVAGAPRMSRAGDSNELVTLIDMDHYIEGNHPTRADWVVDRTYEMHDEIIETFHEHVVTEEAIDEWR